MRLVALLEEAPESARVARVGIDRGHRRLANRKVAVLVTQELHLLDAEDLRRRELLLLPDRGELGILLLGILTALRAVGDDHVGDLRPALGHLRHRAPRAELRVVGMRRHDEHAVELRGFAVARCRAPARGRLLFRHELRLRNTRPEPEAQGVVRRDFVAAPNDASGIAAWIGRHNTSSCSKLRRAREPITRPPNAAVFAAAQPWLPFTRIGTVTTAASAAASSAVRAPPSATAFDRALETSSAICQGCASRAHWFALSRPTALT